MSTIILGGGIAGLSAAYYLRSAAPTLVESSSRLGGWIQTNRRPGEILFEHGPRTIRPAGEQGANTLNLIEDLGLEDKVKPISRDHPAAKNRLIFAKGKLHPLPNSFSGLFQTRPPFEKPLAACVWTDFKAERKLLTDESSYDFIRRRFGQDVADYAISPMLCGICAGNAKEISVKMLFRALFEAEQKHGSVFKGLLKEAFKNDKKKAQIKPRKLALRAKTEKWSIYSLENGLQTLPDVMEIKLAESNIDLRKNDPCIKIKFSGNSVSVVLKSGATLTGKNIICALPAAKVAPLLQEGHPDLAKKLSAQKSATVAVVNVRFKGQQLKEPGFGFLVPPVEQKPLLGVIYDSVCFPCPGGDTVFTAMMGGHWFHPQFTNCSLQDLTDIAVRNIQEILGVKEEPVDVNPVIQTECIPQYTVGHYERLDEIDNYIKAKNLPLHLVGASYRGIGINDVIMSAKLAVDKITNVA
ncbi:protoporphyrinogen oxidase [Neocloeon triangulifer]|uniref:protoporphyrinogen oxidase n=1 Tax=Neocloeon triangulifer TaxID=2078957 RepID=UPI00286F6C93|nr:protoporphyrinogen oxidase [Neocloeon triangulifer]XP_059469671.1 protoporphyrinogen oxidase [Neocloeon triangulifer]XP_059469672.1 protoporphyrinogen oxidase [Neocloeon triangulifer]XP_059469673.1 protoporphyrinogen oxidase [Neocloeon triangulifer]